MRRRKRIELVLKGGKKQVIMRWTSPLNKRKRKLLVVERTPKIRKSSRLSKS